MKISNSSSTNAKVGPTSGSLDDILYKVSGKAEV